MSVAARNNDKCIDDSNVQSPQSSSKSPTAKFSNHRHSTISRRARSFRDDFLEKLSHKTLPLVRSNSPHSMRNKHIKRNQHISDGKKPVHDLNYHVRQVKNALQHFKDVISKNKLEVLPGNGTIVLETIANVHTALQSYPLNENSSAIISAKTKVHSSLGKLIKLCDEVLLSDSEVQSVSLSKENVKEVVDVLDKAVQDLVDLANEKIREREKTNQSPSSNSNTLARPVADIAGQRTSLPDIPLTPRERDILEQSQTSTMRTSHSTESILRDPSPPPKPPLPERVSNPPPLPPKRRKPEVNNQLSLGNRQQTISADIDSIDAMLHCGIDRMSLRSKSPDDNSSLLSNSSLDSALNNSREEEELKALANDSFIDEQASRDDINSIFSQKTANTNTIDCDVPDAVVMIPKKTDISVEPRDPRCSNDSGFLSLQSARTSAFNLQNASTTNISTRFSSSSTSSSRLHQQETMSVMSSSASASSQIISNDAISIASAQQSVGMSSFSRNFSEESNASDITIRHNAAYEGGKVPPALPVKTRPKRIPSQYDNVEGTEHFPNHMLLHLMQNKHQSLLETNRNAFDDDDGDELPPPLPVKKKHIMAYMEMFGNYTQSTHGNSELTRHSVHAYNLSRETIESAKHEFGVLTHSQTMSLSPLQRRNNQVGDNTEYLPPALPPKLSRFNRCTLPPNMPSNFSPLLSTSTIQETIEPPKKSSNGNCDGTPEIECTQIVERVPLDVPVKQKQLSPTTPKISITEDYVGPSTIEEITKTELATANSHSPENEIESMNLSPSKSLNTPNIIEEIDVQAFLIMKKETEDGPDVKGGPCDALIVHACKVQKFTENAFGEAFITTFRTFLSPLELTTRLIQRYSTFCCHSNEQKQKSAKESFSLLVRVVNELTVPDLSSNLLEMLSDFVYQLVCSGQLMMAKLLRNNILDKITAFKQQKWTPYPPMQNLITSQPSLLDLKSAEIAEQMTLLDAELFQKIEIPEVLIWAQEQCEERSPNLTKFTEHFNKMSYWARSQILKQEDNKDREKYVMKFIKIMKHLRKINNYNSYLALLSALDSAPIRRLEWHKTITEGLKEYCALIDSSSSFRAYRQALAETVPPCIPYIGLVLQDLTFVHIGNPDYLSSGTINFSKRWQQYNIVVNMKRFRKCSYPFKKNSRIMGFFDSFDNYLDEDAMWQISENIKPRISRKGQALMN